jgi:hypothetical protein
VLPHYAAAQPIGIAIMETSRSDANIHLRAYYLWEADGRPEGHADEYWGKAQALLKEEARVTAPADQANAAGAFLTQEKRPSLVTQQSGKLPSDAVQSPSSKAPSTRRKKLSAGDEAKPASGEGGRTAKRCTQQAGTKSSTAVTNKNSEKS